jgi:hypothetical protein
MSAAESGLPTASARSARSCFSSEPVTAMILRWRRRMSPAGQKRL